MKNIVRLMFGFGIAAFVLAATTAVRAGERSEEKKHPGMEYFEGKISSLDPAAKKVTVAKKEGTMTFQVDPTCTFYAKGKKTGATFDDFKVADRVSVLYKNVSGVYTAYRLAEAGSNADHKEKHQK